MTTPAELVETLVGRGLTVAVAESLTGGLLVSEFIGVPGASRVIRGGVVAYSTELKHSLLGVSSDLLERSGPVHPDVAAQMAIGVRALLAVGGVAASVGIATTGVAGPGPESGHPEGTAFVAIAIKEDVSVVALALHGSREAIRKQVVYESLSALAQRLGPPV